MSGLGKVLNYAKANPVAVYLIGGITLHFLRTFAVNNAYSKHFAQFDVERRNELESYLATHKPI
jgi:hypothetical protein